MKIKVLNKTYYLNEDDWNKQKAFMEEKEAGFISVWKEVSKKEYEENYGNEKRIID